jgi:hypothetical protein
MGECNIFPIIVSNEDINLYTANKYVKHVSNSYTSRQLFGENIMIRWETIRYSRSILIHGV